MKEYLLIGMSIVSIGLFTLGAGELTFGQKSADQSSNIVGALFVIGGFLGGCILWF